MKDEVESAYALRDSGVKRKVTGSGWRENYGREEAQRDAKRIVEIVAGGE